MKVVITGGGGFLSQVLAKEILATKQLRSESSMQSVTELILADICEPKEYLFDLHSLAQSNNIKLRVEVGDVSEIEYCKSIIGVPKNNSTNALSVFHLGAVMSGAPPGMSAFVLLYYVNASVQYKVSVIWLLRLNFLCLRLIVFANHVH